MIFVCVIGLLNIDLASAMSVNNESNIIYKGQNYVKLKIDRDKYNQVFMSKSSTDEGVSEPSNVEKKEIYSFSSLSGVLESDIPSSLKDEILTDEGFSSWADVSESDLNSPLSLSLDVNAAMDSGSAYSTSSASGDNTTYGLCNKSWRHKVKTIDKVISPVGREVFDFTSGGVSGSLDANMNAQGSIIIDIHYKLKKNHCTGMYYKARYKYTRLRANANLDGSGVSVSANIAYEMSKKLFAKDVKIPILEWEKSWWVYFFEISLELDLYAEYNVRLDAKMAASVEVEQPMTGHLNIDWECNNDGCRKDINDISYAFTEETERRFQAEVDIVLRPYANLVAKADVELYWKSINIAEVELGLSTSIPIRYYGYYGNMCSDGDNDGNNELVSASLLDVNAEAFMYLRLEFINKNTFFNVDLNFGNDWQLVNFGYQDDADCDSFIIDILGVCSDMKVYRKNIYFKDLISGGSSVLTPVIAAPEIVAQHGGGAAFSARTCYPFSDKFNMEISWGDGEVETVEMGKGGSIVYHDFITPGDTLITARIVDDVTGREFEHLSTEKLVNVSLDGQTPFYPWLVPVITSILF
jgi:hypothetical protein